MKYGKWIKKWKVSGDDRFYTVSLSELGIYGCNCSSWIYRRETCRHIRAVKAKIVV